MDSSQNIEVPKENSRQKEQESEIPTEWTKLPLDDMVDKGWRPRIKTRGENKYLTMRFGNQERGLGAYTPEKYDALMNMFPKLKKVPMFPRTTPAPLLSATLSKPQALKSPIEPSMETLNWYEWARSKGFPGSLGDFINDVIHTYFQDQCLELLVVIPKGETQNGN